MPKTSKKRSPNVSTEKKSLTDIAYETIKLKIITSHYKPGEFINESKICKELNFSRSPVHQALHRLVTDKLIQIIPRKGLIVQPISINEITNILEARKLIEPFCCKRATDNATSEEIKVMSTLLSRTSAMIEDRDITGLMDLDHQFHQMIANASKNPVLEELLSGLHIRVARFWSLTWTDIGRLEDVYQEHLTILEQIKLRNAKASALAMEKHINSLMKASLKSIR